MQIRSFLIGLLFLPLLCEGQTFYEYYDKGIESLEVDSLDEALEYFLEALKLRGEDNHQARTYGLNFIEYYPNREMGVLYYLKQDYDRAIEYLERSVSQDRSERAEEYMLYISQVKHSQNLSVIDSKPPGIQILSPNMFSERVFQPVSNHIEVITILGMADDAGGVTEVMVNDQDAVLSGKGEFKADIPLSVGQNEIFVRATDRSRNSITRTFLVYRADTVINDMNTLNEGGKYYALIIGISAYEDPEMTDLDGYPTQDAAELARILKEKYIFEEENLRLLINPSRTDILRAFDGLSKAVKEKDNLLIFYAGHGFYDEDNGLGYWLPADAEKEFTANWIYNDVLVANVKRIRSKHTLLISDACFSGSIFKTRSLEEDAPAAFRKKYELRSRKAITSGVLKTVPNKSIFFKYLAERLTDNTDKYLSGSQLFQDIEIPVANNSPNTPQYGVIHDVGDEGGDFIFILR
ncbi:MAG: caspase family protein [Bacteroidales bacterium]|nr:caspase family protein [Bacteroidales bacterium]